MMANVTTFRERLLVLVDEVLARYTSWNIADRNTVDDLRLAALVDALDRLAAGTYGACIGCAADLGFEHLLEEPAAAMCDNCSLEDSWRPFGPR
jgi:RNA polymerase-binding transcription factor DksA